MRFLLLASILALARGAERLSLPLNTAVTQEISLPQETPLTVALAALLPETEYEFRVSFLGSEGLTVSLALICESDNSLLSAQQRRRKLLDTSRIRLQGDHCKGHAPQVSVSVRSEAQMALGVARPSTATIVIVAEEVFLGLNSTALKLALLALALLAAVLGCIAPRVARSVGGVQGPRGKRS